MCCLYIRFEYAKNCIKKIKKRVKRSSTSHIFDKLNLRYDIVYNQSYYYIFD